MKLVGISINHSFLKSHRKNCGTASDQYYKIHRHVQYSRSGTDDVNPENSFRYIPIYQIKSKVPLNVFRFCKLPHFSLVAFLQTGALITPFIRLPDFLNITRSCGRKSMQKVPYLIMLQTLVLYQKLQSILIWYGVYK